MNGNVMETTAIFSPTRTILSFASLLVCLGIITQDMPRIFINYAKEPYTLPYLLCIFFLAATVMFCGFSINIIKMNSWLQSKWMRIICFILLSPLWISPCAEFTREYIRPLSLILSIDTEKIHLWFGWLVSIAVSLILAQWFAYLSEHKSELVNLMLPLCLLTTCSLLLITFVGATPLSAIIILVATVLACIFPRTSIRIATIERRIDEKPSAKRLLTYLGYIFFIGLSYQILEGASYGSKIGIEPNYIYLITCFFIIFVMIMQLIVARKMQKDVAPKVKLTIMLSLGLVLIVVARTIWVSIAYAFPFDFLNGASIGIYVFAAVCLEAGLLLLLFRTVDYLQGNALRHLLLGKSAFLFGVMVGIPIVSIFTKSSFFTNSTGPESIAFATLVCAIFLVSIFSLSSKDSIMRALFGDGEFPGDTRYLEKVPLKAQYLKEKKGLSQTETEILASIATSHSSKQIAADRHISENTVPTHRDKIFKKLNIHSKDELIDLMDAITDEDLGLTQGAINLKEIDAITSSYDG